MAAFDLIVFDLDGTLVESAGEIADAANAALRAFGWAPVTLQQVRDWVGHGTRELLIQAVSHAARMPLSQVREAPELPQWLAAFDAHYAAACGRSAHLYPGAPELLQALGAHGVRRAVVTNKDGRFTRPLVQALGLAPLLDAVIGGDDMPAKKPDPAGVLACMARFGAARERTLFVGDSCVDAATARAAGIAVWLLPHGYNMGRPLIECAPDRIVPDFAVLHAALLPGAAAPPRA